MPRLQAHNSYHYHPQVNQLIPAPQTNFSPLHIPGNQLEGGGQLVRLTLSLSALTRRPVLISNIRGNRPKAGGLKDQHLTALLWLARVCGARVEGAVKGSKRVLFEPSSLEVRAEEGIETEKGERVLGEKWWKEVKIGNLVPAREVRLNMHGVGAVTLVLQAVLPVLIFTPTSPILDPIDAAIRDFDAFLHAAAEGNDAVAALDHSPPPQAVTKEQVQYLHMTPQQRGSRFLPQIPYLLHLRGGTNVSFSPSIDYITQVLFPNLTRIIGLPSFSVLPRSLERGWSSGDRNKRSRPGSVTFVIEPLAQGEVLPGHPLLPHKGRVRRISVSMLASGQARGLLKSEVKESLKRRAWGQRSRTGGDSIVVDIAVDEDSLDPSHLYLLLVAHMEDGIRLGRDKLWEPKAKLGKNGVREAVEELVGDVFEALEGEFARGATAAVDEWMEDQLVIFQALAYGRSGVGAVEQRDKEGEEVIPEHMTEGKAETEGRGGPSLHTCTARWLVERILGVCVDEGGSCEGIGYVAGGSSTCEAEVERGTFHDWESGIHREVVVQDNRPGGISVSLSDGA